MSTKAELEARWVSLWNEMFDALEAYPRLLIVDEAWLPISFEDCQALVQHAVYEGEQPRFEATWSQGRRVLQVFRKGGEKT